MLTFLIILILAVILPLAFQRLKITHVPFYILGGIIIGPDVIGIEPGEALSFMADIGLYLLIFLAGLEVFETRGRGFKPSVLFIALTGPVTIASGFLLGSVMGIDWRASVLIGLILMSSSVGECIPLINSSNFLKRNYGHVLIPGVVILDGLALVGLGILVALKRSSDTLYMVTYIAGIIVLFLFAFVVLPRLLRMYFRRRKTSKTREADLKFVLLVLICVILVSGIVGVHGIVPAFIVGVVMGEFITSQMLYEKIQGLGHGLFIPLFFVIIGMELDLGVVLSGDFHFLLPFLMLITLFSSKVLGGIVYAVVTKKPILDGITIGISFWPVLSATIAASIIGLKTGIFDQDILISVVIVSVISTLVTPFVLRLLTRKRSGAIKMKDHTVIIGYGRTSSRIASILELSKKKFIVIDNKMGKIEELDKRNVQTVYGSGTDIEVLKEASIEKARVALISITDGHETYLCARHIRELNRRCYIVAKVHTEQDFDIMKKERLANTVIWPEKMSAQIASEVVFEKAR